MNQSKYLNHLSNTDCIIYVKIQIFMKHLEILTYTSMYKVVTDQHEVITLSNEKKIVSNDISGYESDESNV